MTSRPKLFRAMVLSIVIGNRQCSQHCLTQVHVRGYTKAFLNLT